MQEEFGDLPCFRTPYLQVTCWRFPSVWQRIRFLVTGRLWLIALGSVPSPLMLSIPKPTLPPPGAK